MTTSRRIARWTAALAIAATAACAHAAFPDQPIRIVVGVGPGGVLDTMARLLQKPLQESLGQPVVVVNRPGALGALGAAEVGRAKPDGHTLVFTTNSTISALPLMQKSVGFNDKSFAPVGVVALSTMVMVSHPSLPAKDLPSLLAYARSQPKGLDCAVSGGLGSLACELLGRAGNFKVVRVPYKGVADAVNGLLSGEVKFMVNSTFPGMNDHVKAGRLNMIGVTGSPTDLVPGAAPGRQHMPEVSIEILYGLLAPAGTPPDAVEALNRAVTQALAQPELKQRFFAAGAVAAPGSAKDLADRIQREVNLWKPAVEAADLRVE
jgi:tripartite-type tricarboxylate transporter receptor subunit TctC